MTKLLDLRSSPIMQRSKKEQAAAAQDLREAMQTHAPLAELLSDKIVLFDFLTAAMSLSTYLSHIINARPELLAATLQSSLDTQMDRIIADAREAWHDGQGQTILEAEIMHRLRALKMEAALTLALYDLARLSDAKITTGYLSSFASQSLSAGLNHLLCDLHERQKIKLKDISDPSSGSGFAIIGMGKLGAEELNYSSDIDIVAFFDPHNGTIDEPSEATDIYAKMVRRLVHIMQHPTKDGYVFRTDLRLRPDPGSTPLAFPIEAALNYYEARGQNWERAAYIKAKTVAGDRQTGDQFLAGLQPFIFRKYLDYAAIADIHSIKRQIHAHRELGDISVAGHNVKLGRGGIREIEFFVQTQQLIAGGRNPDLRVRRTDEALAQLTKSKWLDDETAHMLLKSYWFLRDVEHRIQMVADQQSHQLPEEKDDLKTIARMMRHKKVTDFSKQYLEHLKQVVSAYAHLFEEEAELSVNAGNLSFTGEDDDAATLKTLSNMGFKRPKDIVRVVREWHRGRYRATRTAQARERLTELTPQLLSTFGKAADPDEALIKFDSFISGLPAGIQLFALLSNNPTLLSLLQIIMTAAPPMRDMIAQRPHIFDGLLDPTILSELPTSDYLTSRLDSFLQGADYYEDVLDRLRIFCAEQKFLIGVRLITGTINGARAGLALSDLAALMMNKALEAVQSEMAIKHGRINNSEVAILAMGKLASCEMTATSDIDMILIYDCEDPHQESDGEKPLEAARYYARLTQRLVAALSAPTAEGVLYDVDLRLRPSGNKGPVATSFTAFSKYQRKEAWVWEHMALSRARCVAGDTQLFYKIHREIDAILGIERSQKELLLEVKKMRALLDKEKPPQHDWDLKLLPGGLIDIEFITQFLSLRERSVGLVSGERDTRTAYLLDALSTPHLDTSQAEPLKTALELWTNLSQVLKFCSDETDEMITSSTALQNLLLKITHLPDMNILREEVKQTSSNVRQIFKKVLE